MEVCSYDQPACFCWSSASTLQPLKSMGFNLAEQWLEDVKLSMQAFC